MHSMLLLGGSGGMPPRKICKNRHQEIEFGGNLASNKAVGTTTAATVLAIPLFMKPFAKCMAVHTSCIISKLFISFLYKLSLLNG